MPRVADAPEKRTRGRRIFDGLAVATLVVFVAFCAVITLCAARIPELKERAARKRLEGYKRTSVRYQNLRFSHDDARLVFDVREHFAHQDDPQSTRQTLNPGVMKETDRVSEPRPDDGGDTEVIVEQVLRAYGLAPQLTATDIVLSHDRREAALLFAATGVVRRDAAGRWRRVAGEELPPAIARIADRPRSLDSADPQEWADAAIGAALRDGARAAVFAVRLIRVHRDATFETDALASLLLCRELRDADPEIARVVLDVRDAGLQRRLVEGAENRARRFRTGPDSQRIPEVDPASRRALVTAVAARDWGDNPTDFVRGWALGAIEDGTFALLDKPEQQNLMRRLSRHVQPSYAARLARAVESRPALEAAAAYLLLRRAVGEPFETEPDAGMHADARAWTVELRARKPDLFKDP